MELVPSGVEPRPDHVAHRRKQHARPAPQDAPLPQEKWLPSSVPAPSRVQPTPSVTPEAAPAPAPSPSAERKPVPVVLNEGDYLARPLTLEDLQRQLSSLGGAQPAAGTGAQPAAQAERTATPQAADAAPFAAAATPAKATRPQETAAVDGLRPAATVPQPVPSNVQPAQATPTVAEPAAPKLERPGFLSRMASAFTHSIHHSENQVMSVFGKSDDTLDLRPKLAEVNAYEPYMRSLTDAQLQGKTAEFRKRLAAGETLDDVLPEAFAAVREASQRVLKMRPYDSQIMGAIAMHQGRVAEMPTGEGKTLTATLPVYLNALTGKGAHVVTVNETLARRDAAWMGKLYNFMGLSVGTVVEGMTPEQKRAAYAADVTYVTNVTLGFDFLRDNMARRKEDVVCRDPNFALVDEVDEILIDEARTPLIISELNEPSTKEYQQFAGVVSKLKPDEDFKVNLKDRQTWLTEAGLDHVEKMLGVDNLYDEQNVDKVHYLRAALIARNIFVRDKDYVVNDGKVDIVDEFTGRIMDGRRFNDGIHQALEAKEGVAVQPEQRTLASITYPNLFRRYHKLSGMSGTAKTEQEEFANLYGLGVSVIPPNRPSQRKDLPDLVYKSYQEKFKAIGDQVEQYYKEGKPVLIGTRNIVINEYLHQILNERGIPHQLLNAKSVKDNTEAENAIIAQAGKAGMVTLATNMAGRGVDIKPDYINYKQLTRSAAESLARGKRVVVVVPQADNLKDVGLWMNFNKLSVAGALPNLSDVISGREKTLFAGPAQPAPHGKSAVPTYTDVQVVLDDRPEAERTKPLPDMGSQVTVLNAEDDAFATGGLHVIGTERHESRRIDNQLKGRAARQGNPGSTQFFVSLDDELMRLFGGDRLKRMFDRLGIQKNQAVQDSMLDKAIESAQKKVEAMHFDVRKNTTKYDGVLNVQRDLYYQDRKAIVDGDADLDGLLSDWSEGTVDHMLQEADVADHHKVSLAKGQEAWGKLTEAMGLPATPAPPSLAGGKDVDVKQLRQDMLNVLRDDLARRKAQMGDAQWQRFLHEVTLDGFDEGWFNHLENMQELQSGIGLVAYGEQDPWIAYQKRAFEEWNDMKAEVEGQIVRHALTSSFVLGNVVDAGAPPPSPSAA